MIRLFKKSLNLQITSLLALILAIAFIILCLVILNRQETLLAEMHHQVNAQITQTDISSKSLFSQLKNDVTASLSRMNEQVTGNLLSETEKSLSLEAGFVNSVLESQVTAYGEAIAGLVAQMGSKSLVENDYTRISELSRSGSTTQEISFILFMDKDNNPLPSFINRVDDRIVSYLNDFKPQDENGGDERLEEMRHIIKIARNDEDIILHEQQVKYFDIVVGHVLVGVDKSSIAEQIRLLNQRFDSLKNNNDQTTKNVLNNEADAVMVKIQTRLDELQNANQTTLQETESILSAASSRVQKSTTYAVSVGGLITCFAVLILISVLLRLTVLGPINGITDGLKDAAEGEGDLTKRLRSKRIDEIGILAGWFDSFVERINSIIVSIGRNSETVTTSSLELLSASDSLQGESESLSTKADSVAAASEKMNGNMISVAAASEQAATNLSIVAETATAMKLAMEEVLDGCRGAIEASNAATSQVKTTAQQVSELGDAAREITKVTEVITDIADQTNLLALNATIEAARAGEAGKGFAVVANEIKELANQTQKATMDIRQRIEGIQSSTNSSVAEVERITQVISDVDKIMSTINASISQQTEKTSDLALNIEQAADGISEVNENVAQSSQVSADITRDIIEVSDIARKMNDRSGELRNSSQSLTDLSTQLREMINVFKVADTRTVDGDSVDASKLADLFPWTDRYAFGLEEIDRQHQKLVSLINALHRAMKLKQGTDRAGRILDELVTYTAEHFAYEEKLFDQYGYKETNIHKKIHGKLVNQVVAFQRDFNSGKAGLTMELMYFLTDWLKDHILKTDREYVNFFKNKGIK